MSSARECRSEYCRQRVQSLTNQDEFCCLAVVRTFRAYLYSSESGSLQIIPKVQNWHMWRTAVAGRLPAMKKINAWGAIMQFLQLLKQSFMVLVDQINFLACQKEASKAGHGDR